jgi:hypothetical protein
VQCPQKAVAARQRPAQQHPGAPKQVQGQYGFRENRCRKNRTITPLCRLPAINYPLNPCGWMTRGANFPVILAISDAGVSELLKTELRL